MSESRLQKSSDLRINNDNSSTDDNQTTSTVSLNHQKLTIAIHQFNYELIKELIEKNPSILLEKNENGLIPAEEASNLVESIIAKSVFKKTASREQNNTARLLFNESALLVRQLKESGSPVTTVSKQDIVQFEKTLEAISQKEKFTLDDLHVAIKEKNEEKVRKIALTDPRLIIKPLDKIGNTALKIAKDHDLSLNCRKLLNHQCMRLYSLSLSENNYGICQYISTIPVFYLHDDNKQPYRYPKHDQLAKSSGFKDKEIYRETINTLKHHLTNNNYTEIKKIIEKYPQLLSMECIDGDFPMMFSLQQFTASIIKHRRLQMDTLRFLINETILLRRNSDKLSDECLQRLDKELETIQKIDELKTDLALNKENIEREVFQCIWNTKPNYEKLRYLILSEPKTLLMTTERSFLLDDVQHAAEIAFAEHKECLEKMAQFLFLEATQQFLNLIDSYLNSGAIDIEKLTTFVCLASFEQLIRVCQSKYKKTEHNFIETLEKIFASITNKPLKNKIDNIIQSLKQKPNMEYFTEKYQGRFFNLITEFAYKDIKKLVKQYPFVLLRKNAKGKIGAEVASQQVEEAVLNNAFKSTADREQNNTMRYVFNESMLLLRRIEEHNISISDEIIAQAPDFKKTLDHLSRQETFSPQDLYNAIEKDYNFEKIRKIVLLNPRFLINALNNQNSNDGTGTLPLNLPQVANNDELKSFLLEEYEHFYIRSIKNMDLVAVHQLTSCMGYGKNALNEIIEHYHFSSAEDYKSSSKRLMNSILHNQYDDIKKLITTHPTLLLLECANDEFPAVFAFKQHRASLTPKTRPEMDTLRFLINETLLLIDQKKTDALSPSQYNQLIIAKEKMVTEFSQEESDDALSCLEAAISHLNFEKVRFIILTNPDLLLKSLTGYYPVDFARMKLSANPESQKISLWLFEETAKVFAKATETNNKMDLEIISSMQCFKELQAKVDGTFSEDDQTSDTKIKKRSSVLFQFSNKHSIQVMPYLENELNNDGLGPQPFAKRRQN